MTVPIVMMTAPIVISTPDLIRGRDLLSLPLS